MFVGLREWVLEMHAFHLGLRASAPSFQDAEASFISEPYKVVQEVFGLLQREYPHLIRAIGGIPSGMARPPAAAKVQIQKPTKPQRTSCIGNPPNKKAFLIAGLSLIAIYGALEGTRALQSPAPAPLEQAPIAVESPAVAPLIQPRTSLAGFETGETIRPGLTYLGGSAGHHRLGVELIVGHTQVLDWPSDDFPSAEQEAEFRAKLLDKEFVRPSHDSDVMPSQGGKGAGRLVIDNNGTADAAVLLKPEAEGGSRRMVYVYAGRKGTISGIKAGSYRVLVRLGSHWNSDVKSFATPVSMFRFASTFEFTESNRKYRVWTVTLSKVANGNARTEKIDALEFL